MHGFITKENLQEMQIDSILIEFLGLTENDQTIFI